MELIQVQREFIDKALCMVAKTGNENLFVQHPLLNTQNITIKRGRHLPVRIFST